MNDLILRIEKEITIRQSRMTYLKKEIRELERTVSTIRRLVSDDPDAPSQNGVARKEYGGVKQMCQNAAILLIREKGSVRVSEVAAAAKASSSAACTTLKDEALFKKQEDGTYCFADNPVLSHAELYGAETAKEG